MRKNLSSVFIVLVCWGSVIAAEDHASPEDLFYKEQVEDLAQKVQKLTTTVHEHISQLESNGGLLHVRQFRERIIDKARQQYTAPEIDAVRADLVEALNMFGQPTFNEQRTRHLMNHVQIWLGGDIKPFWDLKISLNMYARAVQRYQIATSQPYKLAYDHHVKAHQALRQYCQEKQVTQTILKDYENLAALLPSDHPLTWLPMDGANSQLRSMQRELSQTIDIIVAAPKWERVFAQPCAAAIKHLTFLTQEAEKSLSSGRDPVRLQVLKDLLHRLRDYHQRATQVDGMLDI